jgi:hypothetical protein
MLHEILSEYLAEIEIALGSLTNCHFEKYEEEALSSNRVNLRVRIRFAKGHLFELNEAVVVEQRSLKHLSYRYHFQDKENHLIFRYDNTPHFPNLPTQPHHKHLLNDVIPVEKPTIAYVVKEIAGIISSAS